MPVNRESGVIAVEFVILFPLFMLILVGILEFGHLFYVRHTLTNASREGARAGVMFIAGPAADRITKAQTLATDAVKNYLGLKDGQKKVLPGVTLTVPTPQVQASGASAAGQTGSDFIVTISASNACLILGKLFTAFQNLPVSAQTTMKME